MSCGVCLGGSQFGNARAARSMVEVMNHVADSVESMWVDQPFPCLVIRGAIREGVERRRFVGSSSVALYRAADGEALSLCHCRHCTLKKIYKQSVAPPFCCLVHACVCVGMLRSRYNVFNIRGNS